MATARKLAFAYYRLLRFGGEYIEQGALAAESAYQERRLNSLKRQAKNLGDELQPMPT